MKNKAVQILAKNISTNMGPNDSLVDALDVTLELISLQIIIDICEGMGIEAKVKEKKNA